MGTSRNEILKQLAELTSDDFLIFLSAERDQEILDLWNQVRALGLRGKGIVPSRALKIEGTVASFIQSLSGEGVSTTGNIRLYNKEAIKKFLTGILLIQEALKNPGWSSDDT